MLEVEKEMYIQFLFKNKNYLLSKRNYLHDYSIVEPQKVDMTLSGKYLSQYGNLKINFNELDKYPTHFNIKELETAIKSHEQTEQEIIIGAGANGILQNIVKILFKKKGNLVTPFYTFNQVEFAVTSYGSSTRRVLTQNYKVDFDKIKKSINKKTRLIYICNPNNPTGIYEDNKVILKFVKDINIPVVIDESGIEFTKRKSLIEIPHLPKNLLIVRTFSKAYGIANLRIGYLACNKYFKEMYMKNITTNEISGLSCLIALDLLKNRSQYIKKNIDCIIKERNNLIKNLNKIGIEVIESNSNTIMTKTTFDNHFMELLINEGISVVQIPDETNNIHIRIAVQDKNTNQKFISIFTKLFCNWNQKYHKNRNND